MLNLKLELRTIYVNFMTYYKIYSCCRYKSSELNIIFIRDISSFYDFRNEISSCFVFMFLVHLLNL